MEEEEKEWDGEEEEEGGEDSLHTVYLQLYPELIEYPCLFEVRFTFVYVVYALFLGLITIVLVWCINSVCSCPCRSCCPFVHYTCFFNKFIVSLKTCYSLKI